MKYHLPIEIAYTIAPFIVIAGLFYYTAKDENYVNKLSANPDAKVTVTAFKWNWQFTYEGHPYKGDFKDEAGKPEDASTIGTSSEIPILVIPVNKSVRVLEQSKDVIHSFWVPEFLFKRDVMPDLKYPNQFEFTATQTGHFVGRCAELCGTYHSQMNFEVRVVSEADYEKYVTKLTELGPDNPARQALALAEIGQETTATTTYPFNTDRTTRSESKK
jgi:cytochrome c oxidase subunit 2